jgi:AcrR family transcriptional regulator
MRRPRREDVRRRLLTAASEVFLEKGYLDSTLDDIAGRAGLSKGAVYSNFASKQEIFGVLLADRMAQRREVAAHATDPDSRAPYGHRGSEAMADNLIADSAWMELVVEFASRAGKDDGVRETYAPYLRFLHETVEDALKTRAIGAPRPDDEAAEIIAVVLIALHSGLTLGRAADPERFTPELIEKVFGKVLAALLLGVPATDSVDTPDT